MGHAEGADARDNVAQTEPWMRGTHTELDPLRRGVVHALEMTGEDVERWAAELSDAEMEARPGGLLPVGFHLRHLARSLDRLMTYAEDHMLDAEQTAALGTEMVAGTAAATLDEVRSGLAQAIERMCRFNPHDYQAARGIGRKRLPTTLGGLLVHCAEHTQRHSGQMVTTAKLVRGLGTA
jgi:uncharacterized damage-inducible protein DinB